MKTTSSSADKASKTRPLQVSGFTAAQGDVRQQPIAIILKTATDPERQHAAIGKLIKMCRASAVVTSASRGITAEVRRDRDRGHA